MIKIDRLIIVEGKYDKIKLESIVDGLIITTDGFGIFKDKEKIEFIKKMAESNGILILTDSDGAGFKIRNYINGFVPNEYIVNAYTPDIFGKEKRKLRFSSEGKLGVEGMSAKTLMKVLDKAGIESSYKTGGSSITSYDLYTLGIIGGLDSKKKRKELTKALGLPEKISKNNLLKYINNTLSKNEFDEIIKNIRW